MRCLQAIHQDRISARARTPAAALALGAMLLVLAPGGAGAADERSLPSTEAHVAQAAGPQLEQQPRQTAQPAATLYWMVNSHCAAQHFREPGGGALIYHRRTGEGWQSGTSAGFQAQFAPGVPVAIVVHGSFVEWRTQFVYADATYAWIHNAAPGRPLHVVFYNWPSGGPYTNLIGVDVAVRGAQAEFNAFHLSHVLSMVPPESPVCLVGHSHGARTVLATLHLASGGAIQDHVYIGGGGRPRRLRAVLAAAAADHNWLNPGERYDRALLGADVVNFKNRDDLPLNFYPLVRPFGRPALATVGFTDGDREDLGPLGWRAIDVDVTDLVREAHTWPNYLRSQAIGATLARYLQFDDEVPLGDMGPGSVMLEPWHPVDD